MDRDETFLEIWKGSVDINVYAQRILCPVPPKQISRNAAESYCMNNKHNEILFPFPSSMKFQLLQDFLGNESYTKAGVGTLSVVNNLWNDYRITVTEWFELRWTAMLRKDELEQRYGSRLQHIAHHLHNIVMYRDMPDFDMRNFEADELSPESISFAAADVHSFIETYKLFHPFHPIA